MLSADEKEVIFHFTTVQGDDELPYSLVADFLKLLSRLESINESSTSKFLAWLLPKMKEAKDFILMASTPEQATGALQCWAYAKGWETDAEKEDVRFSVIAEALWDG